MQTMPVSAGKVWKVPLKRKSVCEVLRQEHTSPGGGLQGGQFWGSTVREEETEGIRGVQEEGHGLFKDFSIGRILAFTLSEMEIL